LSHAQHIIDSFLSHASRSLRRIETISHSSHLCSVVQMRNQESPGGKLLRSEGNRGGRRMFQECAKGGSEHHFLILLFTKWFLFYQLLLLCCNQWCRNWELSPDFFFF
jgi:hypothetical protein